MSRSWIFHYLSVRAVDHADVQRPQGLGIMPAKLWNRWSSWFLLQEWTKEKNCWHPWNPSSWMASCFAAFYQEHSQEDVCYHVMTAGTEEILDRCQSGKDDIGFVYVSEEQMPSFQYRLECGKLEFQELKRTKAYLYFGKEFTRWRKAEYRRDSERPGTSGAVL